MRISSTQSQKKDDFKRIHGIGPGIENRFYRAQIHTYAQLAALTPYDLAHELQGLAGLSPERISQQDWIGQARRLADEQIEERAEQAEEWAELSPVSIHSEDMAEEIVKENPNSESSNLQSRKHYVNFNVELWLDEDNKVRRTRVIHLQDHSETAWSGWEDQKLINFIMVRARLFQPDRAANATETRTDLESVQLTQETGSGYHTQFNTAATLSPKLMLKEMKVTTMESPLSTHILISCQPFIIQLMLDLSKIDAPIGSTMGYSAQVFAKDLSRGTQIVIGAEQGELLLTEQANIDIEGQPLQPGPYRLEAAVQLTQQSGNESQSQLLAFLDGGGFQVY